MRPASTDSYHCSPLRYPGGKTFLYKFLADVIQSNKVQDGVYAEAYAGGAGAALKLLFADHVERILINDADPCIFSFWYSILHHRSKFLDLLDSTPVSIDEWHNQQEIYKNHKRHATVKVGFAAFYLNRCNRSGIMLKGGPIGGQDQSGKWKIDARYNKEGLRARIEKVGFYEDRIEVTNLDAIDFLKSKVLAHSEVNKMLVYLDPPYYIKGSSLYLNHYHHCDHVTLAKFLRLNRSFKWVMTYDNSPQINELYHDHQRVQFNLSYSANIAKQGTELLIHNDKVEVPLNPDHLNIAC